MGDVVCGYCNIGSSGSWCFEFGFLCVSALMGRSGLMVDFAVLCGWVGL